MVGKYLHHQGVGCYGVTWHQCTYQGEDDYCPSECLHDLLCEKGAMELVVQSSHHSPVLHHCILCESLIQWLCPESIFELNSSAATVTSSKTAWVKKLFCQFCCGRDVRCELPDPVTTKLHHPKYTRWCLGS